MSSTRTGVFAAAVLLGSAMTATAQDVPADYQEVLAVLGKPGDFEQNVLRIDLTRSDLQVVVDGVRLPTALGFEAWLGLTRGGNDVVVMTGDLVLLEDEVGPVVSALLENGLDITALHPHFVRDEPRTLFLHLHGQGSAAELAANVKPVLDLIGAQPAPATTEAPLLSTGSLNTGLYDEIVGQASERTGDVYTYTVNRNDLQVMEMGAEIRARMGLRSWAALAGADADAAIAGGVAVLAWEITPVLAAMRERGIEIVGVHHRMTNIRPSVFVVQYWGRGPAERLVRGFRAALVELGR